jgi:hypothetical protein
MIHRSWTLSVRQFFKIPVRIRLAILLWALLMSLGCGRSDSTTVEATATLVGTWRIVSHIPAAGSDSAAPLRFGARPRGYLVYDATGHVFLQFQDAAIADSVRSRWRDAPDSVLKGILHGFQAYFGTYTVDSVAQLVTHRIEGELLPRFGTVEVATPFHLRGDSLILGADSLEQWHLVRVR